MTTLALLVLLAQGPKALPAPTIHVTAVKLTKCETDGGRVACSAGSRALGERLKTWFNAANADQHLPMECPGAKPGNVTVRIGYEYNDGTIYDDARTQPACIKAFVKRAGDQWLEWYRVLHETDASIDVRTEYTLTLRLER